MSKVKWIVTVVLVSIVSVSDLGRSYTVTEAWDSWYPYAEAVSWHNSDAVHDVVV